MKYKPYPKYKNTGIEWLGEIPEKWNVVRLRFIFSIKKRIAGCLGYDILSITQQGIKIKDIESNEGQNSQDYSKYQIVEIGDYAMNHMDLLTGFVDISRYFGVTSPDYRVFSLTNTENKDPHFFLQILQMCYLQKIFYPFGQGASQFGRWRLPTEAFKDFWYPFPPFIAQNAIATFLDIETARIDSLVVDYEELISLLQEKRHVLISHAVTRGISELVSAEDPELGKWAKPVKFKDSNIEWIGKIPEFWDVLKLKYLCQVTTGDQDTVNAIEEGEYPFFVRSQEIERINTFSYDGEVILTAGDGAGVGKVFHHFIGKFGIHQRVYMLYKFMEKIDTQFLFFYFKELFQNVALDGGAKSTVDSLRRPVLTNFWISIPPKDEQEQIVCYLYKIVPKLDSLIKETQEAIALLKEHRSALIMNVVTGKINVEETA